MEIIYNSTTQLPEFSGDLKASAELILPIKKLSVSVSALVLPR